MKIIEAKVIVCCPGRNFVTLKITTDEGVIGWGDATLNGRELSVAAYLRDEYVSVYVPTTPNPTGGYFVIVRKSDCIELEMSVDAALKYIVSMGVVAPPDPTALEHPR